MKKIFLLAIAFVMAACGGDEEVSNNQQQPTEWDTVTIRFSPYQVSEMTRAAISEYCTHLDVWITDGETTQDFHQATGDDGFGSLSMTLNLTKSYTLYAVAHKANGPATLSNGVIAFPDDKVTHSFFVSRQFTPTKGMSLELMMNRIVAQFSFTTTDQVPDWCKTMRFTISNVYDRWNVSTGGTHQLDRVSTFNNFTTKNDGTVTFNIYAIVTDASTNHTILVEGLNADGDVQETHTLNNVPLQINHRTVATGVFFSDAASSFSFQAQDWGADIDFGF